MREKSHIVTQVKQTIMAFYGRLLKPLLLATFLEVVKLD